MKPLFDFERDVMELRDAIKIRRVKLGVSLIN